MRILIAEDDRYVTNFLKKGLKEEKYAVDICHDGNEALDLVQLNDYDLLILDVMLPGKNGFSVCRDLRSSGNATPVIILSARSGIEDRIKGLREGADDYISKPFSFEELLERIRAIFRRTREFKGNILKTGDLELDPVTRKVTRDGREISLTGKEYGLLEFMMRNKGITLTQTRIIEHVWDMNYDGLSNILNVYINHLREKIDRDHSQKYIRTVRGVGYRIDDAD